MNKESLINILEGYRLGKFSVEEALDELKILPYENLGFAKLDHHRSLRQGFAEVVFCQGKTVGQVVKIIESLARTDNNILATRADVKTYEAVKEVVKEAKYHELARIIEVKKRDDSPIAADERYILVLTAGTGDIPVAEEAAVTAQSMGNNVKKIYDVGVAGIHRLFDQREVIEKANVLVVVAGMEGALASVIGGLVSKPVIAVPTSIGYGANFGGLSALLSMLNSCAAGVAAVNIDNGFGAGRLAGIINKMR